ncbi:triacylglycerol lipase SDP1 [Monoraphidium neglectum]|uniref:Patatin n=1 Tax=Monoraphidium neglectum TaxID=145388 RepID=A0A0D2LQG8_9CHLO|nr:triacylglycerol lipase SDP1 [Monoraphidium neglectum]KIY92161.1 triacylglycerol lipase SDP1 [Monoraphidium neglectum]|eukprot:XP_013891181.1 triacylglycerol lipase SDP1 [Monoraphidium neglectum]
MTTSSSILLACRQIELSFFNNEHTVDLARHFLARGALHDSAFLQRKLQQLLGSYTFLEAYERTGRILNVSVCPADTNEPPRLLNYLTAPQALIWSAVAASSAFPGLFQPQDILARDARGDQVPFNSVAAGAAPGAAGAPGGGLEGARRWRDGSLELDLPTALLGEMFNCNHFIVSQCNPHIVPLLALKRRLGRRMANLLELELRHRCLQAQWLLSDVIPTKWLTLFTQPWEGDVTIVLPNALYSIGKSITNPTSAELMRATKLGERHVWEKLSAIEANCAVEATLDACLARLTNKARERPLGGLANRIPSWLCMSSRPAAAAGRGSLGRARRWPPRRRRR